MLTVDLTQDKYIEAYHNLRRAFLEKNGYQNIITYMIQSDMKNNENYNYYWEEYLNSILKYDIASNKFEQKVIMLETNNESAHWNIDFEKEVVNID